MWQKVESILRWRPAAGKPSQPRIADGLSETDRVAAYWNEAVGRHRQPFAHWESPAPIQEALNRCSTGSTQRQPWFDFTQRFGPFARVAELGSGDGVLVLALLGSPAERVEAYDISPASLDVCREAVIKRFGTDERCGFHAIDLNREPLPVAAFDAIYTTGTMHHIEKLDVCFASIRRALRPGGWLWLNDYVGPPRFQWSDTQMRLANELLATVPSQWRLRDEVERTDPVRLAEMDPSEAVCPDGIPAALSAHFEIVESYARGGTLLAPIFGSGCLSAEMVNSAEGCALLTTLFDAEQELIRDGVIPSHHMLYIARPRAEVASLVSAPMLKRLEPAPPIAEEGIMGDLKQWLAFNARAENASVRSLDWIAPLPPEALMVRTSGIDRGHHFANHGVDIVGALAAASPRPLSDYESILDFGVGVGRVARLFKGFAGHYTGVDVDPDMIAWTGANLPWVDAVLTHQRQPLPFADETFDAVISISVFTHLNEQDQLFYLAELRRVCRPGAILLLTVSGERVLERALTSPAIAAMIAIPAPELEAARASFETGSGFHFSLQDGHLTTSEHQYGATFISARYVDEVWGRQFELVEIRRAAIHDFQDIVVLRRP